jgi:hypothetical protein
MNFIIYNLLNIFNNIEYIHQNYNIKSKGFGFRIYEILFSIFFNYLFDFILYFFGDKNKKRRWYFLHAIINTIICIFTFFDFIKVLLDPLGGFDGSRISLPLMTTISLHLFHILTCFKNLSIVDWMHHLISCLFVGIIGEVYVHGPIINYFLFFLCGLPGGVDYYLLTFNKYGLIERIKEKKINVYLNMWIRVPGVLFGCNTCYFYLLYNNRLKYNIYVSFLIIFLNLYNCIYFATLVVKNYGLHLEKITKINVKEEIKRTLSTDNLKKLG